MPTYNVMFAVNVRLFSGLFDGSIEITIIIWCAWNRTDQSISIKIGHWVTVRIFHFIWHTKSLRTFTWQCTNMYHADNLAFFRTEYLCKTLHFCFFITLYSFARAKFCFYLTSSKKKIKYICFMRTVNSSLYAQTFVSIVRVALTYLLAVKFIWTNCFRFFYVSYRVKYVTRKNSSWEMCVRLTRTHVQNQTCTRIE